MPNTVVFHFFGMAEDVPVLIYFILIFFYSIINKIILMTGFKFYTFYIVENISSSRSI